MNDKRFIVIVKDSCGLSDDEICKKQLKEAIEALKDFKVTIIVRCGEKRWLDVIDVKKNFH
jgi:hypothetical protein